MKRCIVSLIAAGTLFFEVFGAGLSVLAAGGNDANEWTAAAELRNGLFSQAVDILESAVGVDDSAHYFLKLGKALLNSERQERALTVLRTAAAMDSALAPAAWELIGDVQAAQGRATNAISAWRTALDYSIPQRYQAHLSDKIAEISVKHRIDASTLPWIADWIAAYQLTRSDRREHLIDSLFQLRDWAALDTLVKRILDDYNLADNCGVFTRICDYRFPDSVAHALFDTRRLFQLSRKAWHCGRHTRSSEWLHLALKNRDFSTVIERKEYLYHRGMLNYSMGNHANAVKWLVHYEQEFGTTPDLVITLARSYRSQGNTARSAHYYDLHLERYPSHTRTWEILWYRAWQREDSGNLQAALELYRRLYRQHRSSRRADEALFRIALTLYRLGNYAEAGNEWKRFAGAHPSSSLVPGAHYWSAKCLIALGHHNNAIAALAVVADGNPFDYYTFRARDMLYAYGYAQPRTSLTRNAGIESARAWLASFSPSSIPSLSSHDSLTFRTGVRLALGGMGIQAQYYLEPQEIKHRDNLAIQFDIASLYLHFGDPGASFRVARQFRWRIPSGARDTMPYPVAALLYPDAYSHRIGTEARRNGVESWLVSAIIRQESIFNSSIVSPAGAIGLMQIMPATGATIAQELGTLFTTDSLYHPDLNVRFGVHYIRGLLEQFDGNIVLALAGYNAGRHNALRWYKRNTDNDFDLFVENIGYRETRGYVKLVLANYWTYARLGDEWDLPGKHADRQPE